MGPVNMLPVDELFSHGRMMTEAEMQLTENLAEVECARAIVEQEIALRIDENTLPKAVATLLNVAWKDVLVAIYMEDGYESVRWMLAMEITEELLWTLTPKSNLAERTKMLSMLPVVVKVLRQGLKMIAWDNQRSEELFNSLEKYHMSCLRGERQAVQKKAAKAPVKKDDCQIELLDGLSLDEVDLMKESAPQGETGWVYRADSNEWVFIGEPVQKVALKTSADARAKKSYVKTATGAAIRKMGEGDR